MTVWGEREVGLLHGFIRSDTASEVTRLLRGENDVRLGTIADGPITALVTLWPNSHDSGLTIASIFSDASRATALAVAHHEILAAAAAVGDVVPVRIGSVYATRGSVCDLISREGPAFMQALDRVAGGVELGIRISLSTPAGDDGRVKVAAGGRDYLRRLSDAEKARREHASHVQSFRRDLLAELTGLARHIVPRPVRQRPDLPTIIGEVAMLVMRGVETTVGDLVRRESARATALGLSLSMTGPWPPYSFVDLATNGEVR